MIEPSGPSVDGERDERGRFAQGNRLGHGNPHAGRVARLRSALFEAVGEEDLRKVVAALMRAAEEGNVPAAREILDRTLGRPEALDLLERIEALEEHLAQRLAPAPRRSR